MEYDGAGAGDDHSRATAWVEDDELAGGGAGGGGGASLGGGGAVRGTAWAEAVNGNASKTTAPPASKVSTKRLYARISLPPSPYSATLLPSVSAA